MWRSYLVKSESALAKFMLAASAVFSVENRKAGNKLPRGPQYHMEKLSEFLQVHHKNDKFTAKPVSGLTDARASLPQSGVAGERCPAATAGHQPIVYLQRNARLSCRLDGC